MSMEEALPAEAAQKSTPPPALTDALTEDQQLQRAMALSIQDSNEIDSTPQNDNSASSLKAVSTSKKSKGKTKAQKRKDARPLIPCAYCLRGEVEPFDKNGLKFCSIQCINDHRR